jgi:hypothetical protein
MLGRAAVAMWWDVAAVVRAEWENWHTVEHMPERLGIPGFLRGTRWVALSGEPSYFVLYEAAGLENLTSGAYVERLNHPSPWSQRMMPHHRNMVRSLCSVRASSGGGLGGVLATIRFSPQGGAPALPSGRGLTGAVLLESLAADKMPQTAEQKIRGGDARAESILLVCGYDGEAVTAATKALGLAGAVVGYYRPAFSLTPRDLPQ